MRLDNAPSAPLAGWLSPVAVPSRDGSVIVYQTWRDTGETSGIPALRVHDLRSDADELLELGAITPMFSRDGKLAYVRRENEEFTDGLHDLGSVVVRRSLDAPVESWASDPQRYIVAAWAGDRLLVYEEYEGDYLSIFVLDGPGSRRQLWDGGALIAVSPDGDMALIDDTGDGGRSSVVLVRVEDARVVARLAMDPDSEERSFVGYSGSWVADRVVTASGPGLVVFRIGSQSISIDSALRLDESRYQYPKQPRFLDRDGSKVLVWTDAPEPSRATIAMLCILASASCTAYRFEGSAEPVFDPTAATS